MSEKANWKRISHARKGRIATAINLFGDGGHPVASATNLEYFDLTYMLNCLMSGIEHARKKRLLDKSP